LLRSPIGFVGFATLVGGLGQLRFACRIEQDSVVETLESVNETPQTIEQTPEAVDVTPT